MREANVGTWYEDLQNSAQFKVVAIDDAAQTVEVQMIEGEICEFDIDSWALMHLRQIDEPEDWRNPYELADDDARDPDRAYIPDDGSSPLDNIEPDIINGLDDELP